MQFYGKEEEKFSVNCQIMGNLHGFKEISVGKCAHKRLLIYKEKNTLISSKEYGFENGKSALEKKQCSV